MPFVFWAEREILQQFTFTASSVLALSTDSPLTEGEFLPRVWGKCEAEHGHAGDEDAGDDEVEEVVESPPAYLDGEGDVQVGGRAALVPHLVPFGRNSYRSLNILVFWLEVRAHGRFKTMKPSYNQW